MRMVHARFLLYAGAHGPGVEHSPGVSLSTSFQLAGQGLLDESESGSADEEEVSSYHPHLLWHLLSSTVGLDAMCSLHIAADLQPSWMSCTIRIVLRVYFASPNHVTHFRHATCAVTGRAPAECHSAAAGTR